MLGCLSSVLNVDPAGQGDKQGSQQLGVPGAVIVVSAESCGSHCSALHLCWSLLSPEAGTRMVAE